MLAALAKAVKPEVKRSPALSLMARPGDGSVRGRKVAVFVADGCLGQSAADVHAALFAAARMRGLATPDALSHAASGIHGVLVRTAERGTEEMRIVESAGVMLDPRPRFAAVALPAS